MADNILSTYPVDFERTAIAVGYSNRVYVADEVLPRVTVARKEYRYTEYPIGESFTVPDTRIGRRSSPTMVHFSASEKPGACADYGLEDAIPDDDVSNAPASANPVDRATMRLTDLLMIDRERRVADLVFRAAKYPSVSKVTLAGDDRWSSDSADSDPIADIVGAMEGMVVPPTHLLLGSEVWRHLRTHKVVLQAVHRTDGDRGIASRQAVADLFDLPGGIVVGQAWINSKAPGQAPVLRRVWGKSALLYRRDPNADASGPPTLGITASYRGREVRSGFDAQLGARGAHRVRVVDSVEERIIAPLAGYLFDAAVA